MLMADTMAIFFVILGLMLAFPGLWLLCRGLWPQVVTNAEGVCARGLIKPFLMGLPTTVAMIFLSAALGKAGTPGKIGAAVVVCFYLMIANSGVAGLVTGIGARLASPGDTQQPWRATLRGGIVLELAFLLPILGWFVILPAAMTIGAGAACIALLRKLLTSKADKQSLPQPAVVANSDSTQYAGTMGAGR